MAKYKITCGFCNEEFEENDPLTPLWEYIGHLNECHTLQGKVYRATKRQIEKHE